MDSVPTVPKPRRRKLTPADLYFPPHIVRAVRAEESACGVKPGKPVTLAGGCVLHRLAPVNRARLRGTRDGNDAA